MKLLLTSLAAAGLVGTASAQFKAIARIRGTPLSAQSGCAEPVSGTITFEQATPLGDMTVTADVKGLRQGKHGFHVHQFGDDSDVANLEFLGLHFVAYCSPVGDTEEEIAKAQEECNKDTVHGLPPDPIRQSGDMGNIEADSTCTILKPVETYGQAKMSLTDKVKSIVGRTVLIHEKEDDGTQPNGNAGNVYAYGVITVDGTSAEEVMAPSTPTVLGAHCNLFKEGDLTAGGRVVFSQAAGDAEVLTKAKIEGLTPDGKHAWHFTEFGDTSAPGAEKMGGPYLPAELKPIELGTLTADADGLAEVRTTGTVTVGGVVLGKLLGRGIVVHETEDPASKVIARGACGMSSDITRLPLSIDPADPADPNSPSEGAAGAGAAAVLAAGAAFLALY